MNDVSGPPRTGRHGDGVHRPAARPPWRPRPAPPGHPAGPRRAAARSVRGADGPRPGGGTGLWGMGGFGTLAGMRHACRALVCSVGPPPPACRAPLDNPPGLLFSTVDALRHSLRTCYVSLRSYEKRARQSALTSTHGPTAGMVAVGRAVGEGAPPPIRIDV